MNRMILLCGALAAGEFLASFIPRFCAIWPLCIGLSVLTALLGYGLACRSWPQAFAFFLGAGLFLLSSSAREQVYREKPWLRGCRETARSELCGSGEVAWSARQALSRRMGMGVRGEREGPALVRAILLGERRGLSRRTRQTFAESGTMHVFAISGLHVMAVGKLISCLLALLLIPRRMVGLAAVPVLWAYVWVIGFPPSAVRAAIMATLSCVAPVCWRKPDGLKSWELTFLGVHVLCPRMIVNVGSALSFGVMLAIVLVGNAVRELSWWKRILYVTLAAWAAGVPISARVFGRVTPGGLLASLVLVSTARLTVVTGALGALAGFVCEKAAGHLNNLSALLVRVMLLVADAVARIPGAHVETERWTLVACAAWYLLAALGLAGLLQAERRRPAF